ncbi:MAG: DUF502 domain-containing protein [Hyphomicrobium zavarzinii]|jgi:uncharacterized membrane protein|uniref:DUF502 domain-containing protein n=1 Tax=Hyphomicrobium zavarzinii TaxID=48292 RepID=UPI001A579983|nr:DUF502 domain-containing protein [Hyphomicrobium zavarzinii]MBL8844605.1 DUF502 domain-containing protein [Hyphomicrobium zavarzinii]
MTNTPSGKKPSGSDDGGLSAGLQRLATDDGAPLRIGARLRNYFLTGLIIVGPVTLTIYIIWWVINVTDAWLKPFVPRIYLPDTYLPFAVPGIGLLFGILFLTVTGALAANLLGRSLISFGEMALDRMPIVRNVYRALKQFFESLVSASASGTQQGFQKVGLIEFPSKGLWSIVFVTGETKGEINIAQPGGEEDLLTVFMPTGIVPPTGFICFVPRRDVKFLKMSVEDAAKIVMSAGMVVPDYEARLKQLAERGIRTETKRPPPPAPGTTPESGT